MRSGFRSALLFLILLLLCGLPGACADPLPANVVLITVDTVRADRMGFLGSMRGLTPQMDSLAREGVVFEHAYSQAPLTTVSHASILSGTYPTFHGVVDFHMAFPADVPHIADQLRGRGFHTAAFVGSIILDPHDGIAPGFDRGFETYDASFPAWKPGMERYGSLERRADDVVNRVIAWLKSRPEGPFFIWVHLYDAHEPYDPPADFAKRFPGSPYDAEIAYADSAIGRLLAELRAQQVFGGSLIVIAADHGEGLGDHGEKRHGYFLYDSTIHVPLLMKLPQAASAGTQVATRVQLVDIAPTIVDVVGAPPVAAMQGTSLLRLLGKNPPVDVPLAYSETLYPQRSCGWSPLAALRSDEYLYIRAPRPELYDSASDPNATRNLDASMAAVAGQMDRQLGAIQTRTKRADSATPRATPLDARASEALASLGYLESASRSDSASARLADPKDKIQIANTLHDATIYNERSEFQRAIPLLKSVLASDPQIFHAYMEMGEALEGLNDLPAAVAPMRKAIEIMPTSSQAHYALGKALLATGDWPGAAGEVETALRYQPEWPRARFLLATIYAGLHRRVEAIAELQQVVEGDPDDYNTRLLLGRFLVLEGKPAEGVPHLEQAVALQPDSAETRALLADAYRKAGRTAEAEKEQAAADRFASELPVRN